jgi:lipopolysaccharide transport system ATP-binding protein
MNAAIKVEGLGKSYRIGRAVQHYHTLRENLTDLLTAPFRRRARGTGGRSEEFWALRDLDIEIRPGEVVGIIGRNGAGKSTLLKVLSRITKPTTGQVRLRGRVGSLLEVGTGFHPELTGRENISLNGSILGMSRREIARKFDEIVTFAEVERFLDTPVKRYSSGMYVRLAFAVAAHLEPEILVVDEVLAVGDARFQKKCLNKLQDVGQGGRTVLFVSHNMAAVTRLCSRTILLDAGRIIGDGPSHHVTGLYLRSGLGTTAAREWSDTDRAPCDDLVRLRAVRIRADDGRVAECMDIRRPVGVEMEFEVLKAGRVLVPNFGLFNEEGVLVFITHDCDPAWRRRPREVGRYVSTAWVPGNFLAEGCLTVDVAVSEHNPVAIHLHHPASVAFQVVDSLDGDSARGDYAGHMPGVVRPLLRWDTRFESNGGHPDVGGIPRNRSTPAGPY